MRRALYIILGSILAIIGGLIFISPMPLGFLFLLPGIALLIMGSDTVARWIRRRRERNQELDEKLDEMGDKLPGSLERPLKETDPD